MEKGGEGDPESVYLLRREITTAAMVTFLPPAPSSDVLGEGDTGDSGGGASSQRKKHLPETWVLAERLYLVPILSLIHCVTSTGHLASLVLFLSMYGYNTTLPVTTVLYSGVSYGSPDPSSPANSRGGELALPEKETPLCS